jgi:hypothetical protein
MKKLLIGLSLLSSLTALANDIILKPGKSVILEANVPTRVTCEQDGNLAPYLCRLQFESYTDLGTGQPVLTALKITMKNKNTNDGDVVYLRTKLYRVADGRNEQERSNYTLENDRIVTRTNDELNELIARGICQKH